MSQRKSNRRTTQRKSARKRSQTRQAKNPTGHSRGKASAKPPSKRSKAKAFEQAQVQLGLRLLGTEKSVSAAAHKAQISPGKLRRNAIKSGVLKKKGGRWVITKDVPRQLLVYSGGQEHTITVKSFRTASRVGKYMRAVRSFLESNDLDYLEPFAGKSVIDMDGTRIPFETRPNVLHRLASGGDSSFEQIYRIVV